MDLATFIAGNLGVANVGDTAVNAGQCVGLVEKWLDVNGKKHIWGNAKDLLQQADLKQFKVTRNLPLNAPQPGADRRTFLQRGRDAGPRAQGFGAPDGL